MGVMVAEILSGSKIVLTSGTAIRANSHENLAPSTIEAWLAA